ncbi:uncharacterized protein WCC33_013919 [Rhinophrynus dorsalis]
MPKCIVRDCKNSTRKATTSRGITLHVFPYNLDRIKQWLQQTGQNFGDLDTFAQRVLEGKRTEIFRICSDHFSPDSYIAQGSRYVLKTEALPTIFPGNEVHSPIDDNASLPPRKQLRKMPVSVIRVGTASDHFYEVKEVKIESNHYYEVKHASTNTDLSQWNRGRGMPGSVRMVDACTSATSLRPTADKCLQFPEPKRDCGESTQNITSIKQEPGGCDLDQSGMDQVNVHCIKEEEKEVCIDALMAKDRTASPPGGSICNKSTQRDPATEKKKAAHDKLLICPKCHKCFSLNSELVKHHTILGGEKGLACSACDTPYF